MSTPDVSVIIGAYNAMPYFTACLQSVVDQSIGLDRLEVVAVDDGSTDATGKELDEFAARYPGVFRVVHQENSGSPSGPRNRGLDIARGRYVFFLDADDYFGREALERMVAMADQQGSDIVLGKMVGVGRGVPRTMFSQSQPRADLYSSRVWWSRSAQKLFRRSLLQRLSLRFPTHYRVGEDQLFTAQAYLAAKVISVVADHDCYYLTKRDDGGNITTADTDLENRLRFVEDICVLIGERVEAGPRRDYLLHRQFGIELQSYTGKSLLHKEPEEQYRLLTQAQKVIQDWGTDGALEPQKTLLRLRFHLIARGQFDEAIEVVRWEATDASAHDVVVEDGIVYATYPFFRDRKVRVPDSCYDISRQLKTVHHLEHLEVAGAVVRLSGHAYIPRLDTTDNVVEVLLRERGSGVGHRLSTTPVPTPDLAEGHGEKRRAYPRAGFAVGVDLSTVAGGEPLPRGLWDVHLLLTSQGVRREIRLGSKRSSVVDTATTTRIAAFGGARPTVFTTYFTKPYSNLTLDVGEAKHQLRLGAPQARWSEADKVLLVGGDLDVAQVPDDAVSVCLRDRTGMAHRFPVILADGGYRGAIPAAAMTPGQWLVTVSVDLATGRRDLAVARPTPLATMRWRTHLRPFYAKPVGSKEHLELRVAPVDIVAGVHRRLGKVFDRTGG